MPLPVLVTAAMVSAGSKLQWSKQPNGGISTYKRGAYCGPGWGFTYKDILEGKISKLPGAVDAIDAACKAHDHCYEENGYLTQGCNLVLTVDLAKVVVASDSSPQQRVDAAIMAAIFFVKSQTIDLGRLAKDEHDRMRDRILGYLGHAHYTLEQAITKEIMSRANGLGSP